jgi:alpha-L-rhamnosidase
MGKGYFPLLLAFSIAVLLACSGERHAGSRDTLHAGRLRCETLINPAGVERPAPRLSWSLRSDARGQFQTAYRVLVASSPETLSADHGDLWDSQRIDSSWSTDVPYAGVRLSSGQACHWKVKVWDRKGRESEWSEPASWIMGLLDPSEWKASWIGLERPMGKDDPESRATRCSARHLRKVVDLAGKPKRAVVFYAGLGLSELWINGRNAGDAVLSPGLTEYAKRVFYVTIDATPFLVQGKNAIGIVLGNGRYFAPRRDEHVTAMVFPKLILQMRVEYADGTSDTIVSDGTWKITTDGPITANNEYDGETYDARKELPGWSLAGFDDAKWRAAEPVRGPEGRLMAQDIEPIRVTQTIRPVRLVPFKPGVVVVDLGQNMVGWVRLTIRGAKPGASMKLRFAETLNADGSLYTANLRSARAEDVYTARGDSVETWEPRFTYHGFRFVECTGIPGTPDLGTIEGRVVHDNVDSTGAFECSDATINRVFRNVVWGVKGNYRSMPTDCPQRDERQGWLGDRVIGAKGESFLFDIHALYRKWLRDIEDSQNGAGSIPDVAPTYWKIYTDNTTWPGAFLILADMLFTQYGDTEAVRLHYPAMHRWMQYMERYLKDGLMPKDTYGDWCVPPETPSLIHSQDPGRRTPAELIGTTYFCYESRLMQKFARLTGRFRDAAAYGEQADRLEKALNDKLFDPAKGRYANNSATSNLLPLAFGLVPEPARAQVFDRLVEKILGDADGHTAVGLVGAEWVMRALTGFGRPDIAVRLAANTTYPSWGYMAENGATTVWELWNGNTADPAMNSGNHVMLVGDLIVWLYENLAGIQSDPEKPGFKHLLMRPVPAGGLTAVRASFQSPVGRVSSEWSVHPDRFEWAVTVPPNSGATVSVPAPDEKSVRESGRPAKKAEGIRFLRMEKGYAAFEVESGTYRFSVEKYMPPALARPVTATPTLLPRDTSAVLPSKVRIRMQCRTEGAQIRYTLDGSEPNERSLLYEEPIETDRYVVVSARAYKAGYAPSYTRTSVVDVFHPETNGMAYTVYEGNWIALPEFSKLRPKKAGFANGFDLKAVRPRQDHFGIVFKGFIRIPSDGDYRFFLSSDDGSRLSIDGSPVVVNDSVHAVAERAGTVRLIQGKHRLLVEFFKGQGDDALSVDIEGPGLTRQPIPTSFLSKK